MIKQLIEPLAPILTKIVNLSLRDGTAPRTRKSATVTPLIKKVYHDQYIMKNYNIKFVFYLKNTRKCCIKPALSPFSQRQPMEPMQSANRKHHSTETTFLRYKMIFLWPLSENWIGSVFTSQIEHKR